MSASARAFRFSAESLSSFRRFRLTAGKSCAAQSRYPADDHDPTGRFCAPDRARDPLGGAMADLKLAQLPDRTPVKLTIAVMPDLHQALADYAALYAKARGRDEPVVELIPAMFGAFLEGGRAIAWEPWPGTRVVTSRCPTTWSSSRKSRWGRPARSTSERSRNGWWATNCLSLSDVVVFVRPQGRAAIAFDADFTNGAFRPSALHAKSSAGP